MKKAGIVLGILVLIGSAAFLKMADSAEKALTAMVYEEIDMSLVADGTYYGEADAGLVYVKAGVTVEDNTIRKIDIIEHRNGLGSKAESITESMVAQNSYAVDGISGATLSSESIKSAVSKALKDGYSE